MTELEKIDARERELMLVDVQVPTFTQHVRDISPRFVNPRVADHLVPLYRVCERTRWEPTFATISLPPRHGKTETLAHLLSWWPRINPAVQNFYVTFSEDLRNATMRKTTKLAERAGIAFARDVKNLHEWHVAGYEGGLVATTVGGPITGRGCNGGVMVGDDLVKGRAAAESRKQRDTVWDYLKADMFSRLEFGASVIIVHTRWHEDDPIGRLHKDSLGQIWDHIVLPAVHDGRHVPVDNLDASEATPLWEEGGYGLQWARSTKARGEYDWASLYQQQPRPKGTRCFGEPARFMLQGFTWPQGARGAIGCDVAGTAKTQSDWSTYVVMAMRGWGVDAEVWVLYAMKMQLRTDQVAEVYLRAQRKHRLLLAVEVNGVGRGVADQVRSPRVQVEALERVNSRLRMVEVTRTRDKYVTAQGWAACWNRGRAHVPLDADWDADDYIEQHQDFTGLEDAQDDLVDGSVNGYNHLWRSMDDRGRWRTEIAEDF